MIRSKHAQRMVLVTGAAGFIGSHTVDALLAKGCRVVGLDDLSTGSRLNLALALRDPGFHFVMGDVTKDAPLIRVAEKFRPSAIIHLAALVSVQKSVHDPVLNFELNVAATHRIAEIARRFGIARVVYASSAAVYGDPVRLPLSETSPTAPISPYGAAKLASENLLLGCARTYGYTARCQRYFNVYGPRQYAGSPYAGVLSIFAQRCLSGRGVEIFGDGNQTRDFIAVRDVARANVLAVTAGCNSGVANICTGKETSLRQIVCMLRTHFPSMPPVVFSVGRHGDIQRSLGTCNVARRELGFVHRVPVTRGLGDYLASLIDGASSVRAKMRR